MLKNYTSGVPAHKSVSRIEAQLAAHGAQSVVKQYVDRRLAAVSFFMQLDDRLVPFRLPARVDRVEQVLTGAVRRPRKSTLAKVAEQAERTAWKIISDWVDAQMALIELQQADLAEVFLPYIWDEKKGRSFYQAVITEGYTLLPPPRKDGAC